MYFVAKLQGCANLAKRAPIHDEFISRIRESAFKQGGYHSTRDKEFISKIREGCCYLGYRGRRLSISGLEHRTPDRRARVRCHQMPSEYTRSTCSLNQWVRKSCGRSQQKPRVQNAGEYFPPLQFHAKIMEVEISGVTIYRVEVQPVLGSGNFHSFPSGGTQQQL
ncbi:hypothetical protein TNCV_3741531 [Trichonephila clavipes]|nr:hypothetical protein TNCV_3741531 [Trichonephila clavipes]